MRRTPVTSSHLRSIGYDAATQILEVEFISGEVYQYQDVPGGEYRNLLDASSHGQYFNEHIKDTYQAQRVTQ